MPTGIVILAADGTTIVDSNGLVKVATLLGKADMSPYNQTLSIPNAWTAISGTTVSFSVSRPSWVMVSGMMNLAQGGTSFAGAQKATVRVDSQAIDVNYIATMSGSTSGYYSFTLLPSYFLPAGSYSASCWLTSDPGTSSPIYAMSATTRVWLMGG